MAQLERSLRRLERIVLAGVELGPFRIELHLDRLSSRPDFSAFGCVALEPHPAAAQPGRASDALPLFAQARAMFVQEKNQAWPWLIDLYQAIVLFDSGRDTEARRLCTGAATPQGQVAVATSSTTRTWTPWKRATKARGPCRSCA